MHRLVVAKTKEADDTVFHTWGRGNDYIEWSLTEVEFRSLEKGKVFEKMSQYFDIPVDEFEFDFVSNLGMIKAFQNDLVQIEKSNNPVFTAALNKLNDAFTQALNNKTSFVFFF